MITGKALEKVIQFITKTIQCTAGLGVGVGVGVWGGGGSMYFQEPNCHCKRPQHLLCFVCIVV